MNKQEAIHTSDRTHCSYLPRFHAQAVGHK